MSTKRTDRCLLNAGEDEPIFVLRSTDTLAPRVIEMWSDLAAFCGTPMDKVNEARQLANRMREWQVEHLDAVHVPD